MPLILSIETSTKVCAVALNHGARLIATQLLHVEKTHATSLLPMINHMIAVSPYEKRDLSAVAIASGPGSYTGLRIGATTAQGLCYALNIPLISVNTLEAMAHGMSSYNVHNALLCPLLDARRMKVYCSLVDARGRVLLPTQSLVITSHEFTRWLNVHPILFFGDGADKCKPFLSHRHAFFIDHVSVQASHIGALAHTMFLKNEFADLNTFTPSYFDKS